VAVGDAGQRDEPAAVGGVRQAGHLCHLCHHLFPVHPGGVPAALGVLAPTAIPALPAPRPAASLQAPRGSGRVRPGHTWAKRRRPRLVPRAARPPSPPPLPRQALGLEVRSVLAIGGIGGLAIGLAGREICENLLNGFLLMTTVGRGAGQPPRSDCVA
jgi:hypothetical protein